MKNDKRGKIFPGNFYFNAQAKDDLTVDFIWRQASVGKALTCFTALWLNDVIICTLGISLACVKDLSENFAFINRDEKISYEEIEFASRSSLDWKLNIIRDMTVSH